MHPVFLSVAKSDNSITLIDTFSELLSSHSPDTGPTNAWSTAPATATLDGLGNLIFTPTPGANLEDNGSDWTGATGATPPTGWALGRAGIFTIFDSGDGSPYDKCLKLAVNAVVDANPYIKDSATTTIGEWYKFSFRFKHGTGTGGLVALGNTDTGTQYKVWTNLADAAWTTYTAYFKATTTTTYFFLRAAIKIRFCIPLM